MNPLLEPETFEISFVGPFPPVRLAKGVELSEYLTVQNSPILFGCRIGICGTCAVELVEDQGQHPRTENESEYLEALCPEDPTYRLACQMKACANVKLRKIKI